MTAQEYLGRVRKQYRLLHVVERERGRVYKDICCLHAQQIKERVTGSKQSGTDDLIIRLETATERVNSEWDTLISMRDAALRMINVLRDPDHQAVLRERYVSCRDWENIAVDLGYSWRKTFYVHRQALKDFESVHRFALTKCVIV